MKEKFISKIISLIVNFTFLYSNLIWAVPDEIRNYTLSPQPQLVEIDSITKVFAGSQVVKNLLTSGINTKKEFYQLIKSGRIGELEGWPCVVFSDVNDEKKLAYYVFNSSEPYFLRITEGDSEVRDALSEYLQKSEVVVGRRITSDKIKAFSIRNTDYYQQVYALTDRELLFINECLRNIYPDWEMRINDTATKKVIESGGLGILIPSKLRPEGFKTYTPDEYPLQVGINTRKKGTKVGLHIHLPRGGFSCLGQEVLYIEKGRVRVVLADIKGESPQEIILEEGDLLLMTQAHAVEFLEDSQVIEIKQGPYPGSPDFDKRFIEPVGEIINMDFKKFNANSPVTVYNNGEALGIFIPRSVREFGYKTYTNNAWPLQMGINVQHEGYKGKFHIHKPRGEGEFKGFGQEIIYVGKGKIKLTVCDEKGCNKKQVVLKTGDTVLIAKGHHIEFLEDSELIEIKQGPYPGSPELDREIIKEGEKNELLEIKENFDDIGLITEKKALDEIYDSVERETPESVEDFDKEFLKKFVEGRFILDPNTGIPQPIEQEPGEIASLIVMHDTEDNRELIDRITEIQERISKTVNDLSRKIFLQKRQHLHTTILPFYVKGMDIEKLNPDQVERLLCLTRRFLHTQKPFRIRFNRMFMTKDGTIIVAGYPNSIVPLKLRKTVREDAGFPICKGTKIYHIAIGRIMCDAEGNPLVSEKEYKMILEIIGEYNRTQIGESYVDKIAYADDCNKLLPRSINEWIPVGGNVLKPYDLLQMVKEVLKSRIDLGALIGEINNELKLELEQKEIEDARQKLKEFNLDDHEQSVLQALEYLIRNDADSFLGYSFENGSKEGIVTKEVFRRYADKIREEDCLVLRLAMILHDIGKRLKGVHPENSFYIAKAILRSLVINGLTEKDKDRILWLIRYHDVLGNIFTGERSSDFLLDITREFSREEREKMLALLQIVVLSDVRGTGRKGKYGIYLPNKKAEFYLKLSTEQEILRIREDLLNWRVARWAGNLDGTDNLDKMEKAGELLGQSKHKSIIEIYFGKKIYYITNAFYLLTELDVKHLLSLMEKLSITLSEVDRTKPFDKVRIDFSMQYRKGDPKAEEMLENMRKLLDSKSMLPLDIPPDRSKGEVVVKVLMEGLKVTSNEEGGFIIRGDYGNLVKELVKQKDEITDLRTAIDRKAVIQQLGDILELKKDKIDDEEIVGKIQQAISDLGTFDIKEFSAIVLSPLPIPLPSGERDKVRGKQWLLGFNSLAPPMAEFLQKLCPNPTLGYAREVLDNLEGDALLEYLLHEALCRYTGHYEARRIQEILFAETNYIDSKGEPGKKEGIVNKVLSHIIDNSGRYLSVNDINWASSEQIRRIIGELIDEFKCFVSYYGWPMKMRENYIFIPVSGDKKVYSADDGIVIVDLEKIKDLDDLYESLLNALEECFLRQLIKIWEDCSEESMVPSEGYLEDITDEEFITSGIVNGAERILDIGTGTGYMAIALAERFPNAKITGVDISDRLLGIARKRAEEKGLKIDFINNNATRLAFEEESFDVVFLTSVLKGIPRPLKKKILKEAFRVLKPGGRLNIYDEVFPVFDIDSTPWTRWQPQNVLSWNMWGWKEVLEEIGFVVNMDKYIFAQKPVDRSNGAGDSKVQSDLGSEILARKRGPIAKKIASNLYVELWEADIKDLKLQRDRVLPAGEGHSKLGKINRAMLEDVLMELGSDKQYGPGILAVVDGVRIVDNIDADKGYDRVPYTMMIEEDGKNILLLDVDAFDSEELLYIVLEHELKESIMSIIPCENEAVRKLTMNFMSLKLALEEGIRIDKAKLKELGADLGFFEALEVLQAMKQVSDNDIIAVAIEHMRAMPYYVELFQQFSFAGDWVEKIKDTENRYQAALQVFNEIEEAKEMASKAKETKVKVDRAIKGLGDSMKKVGMIVNNKPVWELDFVDALVRNNKYIMLDRSELAKPENKYIRDWIEKLVQGKERSPFIYSDEGIQEGINREDVIHLVEPERVNEQLPQDRLYLPLPYSVSSIYLASQIVLAGGKLAEIQDRLVFTTIRTLYETLLGRDVADGELEQLFRTPWTVLPPIVQITGILNALRKAMQEIEVAA